MMRWKILFTITFLLALSTIALIFSTEQGTSAVASASPVGCANIPSPWTYCNSVEICKSATSPPTYALAGPGAKCSEGFTKVEWKEKDQPAEICAIALAMALEPKSCPSNCDDGGVEDSPPAGSNGCCSMTKIRVCKDKPKPAQMAVPEY